MLRHLPLALQHMHRHCRLIVVCGGKHLIRLRRNRCVFLNQLRHNAAQRLNTKRQGCYIQEKDIFHVATEYAALDRRTHSDRLVGIDVATRIFSEEIFDRFLHFRHTSLSTYKQDVVDVRCR